MRNNKKIKIIFDAGPMVNGQKSGVGIYTHGLVTALAKANPDSLELVGHYFDFLGRKQGLDLPLAPNIRYRRTILYPGKIPYVLRRLGLSLPFEFFTKERGDFHLFPGFLSWPSLFGTPSAPAIHDLAYLEHPQYVSARNQQDLERFVPATIKRSSFIITISESTKQKLLEHYPTTPDNIVVGHIPPVPKNSLPDTQASDLIKKLGINKQFVLFVGNIEPRKNIVGLLRAYEQLPEATRKNYALVLAGGKGWNDDEIIETLAKLKAKNMDIVQTGYVTDDQRTALYQQASLYVLPTHYEGFGMPVLEAMTYNIPVAISDIPVLREVAGNAAIYFDQNDVRDIAAKIQQALTDKALREKLVSASKKNLARFSWDKTAAVIYEAIKSSLER